MRNSGKLLILAMFLVAFVAAGASWWFRYAATHRAAQFWGPEAARLIRDAPHVELLTLRATNRQILRVDGQLPTAPSKPTDEVQFGSVTWPVDARRDISAAPGLTHLRNALLEDRSFSWDGTYLSDHDEQWTTAIIFRENGENESLAIVFLKDFQRAQVFGTGSDRPRMIGTQPIAAGLAETVNDWSQLPAAPR
jgi:hypothetical protein